MSSAIVHARDAGVLHAEQHRCPMTRRHASAAARPRDVARGRSSHPGTHRDSLHVPIVTLLTSTKCGRVVGTIQTKIEPPAFPGIGTSRWMVAPLICAIRPARIASSTIEFARAGLTPTRSPSAAFDDLERMRVFPAPRCPIANTTHCFRRRRTRHCSRIRAMNRQWLTRLIGDVREETLVAA